MGNVIEEMTKNAQCLGISVKYFPPIPVSSKCKHKWKEIEHEEWVSAMGEFIMYWSKCTKCNTKMLREEKY